jgi:hypothetical protein
LQNFIYICNNKGDKVSRYLIKSVTFCHGFGNSININIMEFSKKLSLFFLKTLPTLSNSDVEDVSYGDLKIISESGVKLINHPDTFCSWMDLAMMAKIRSRETLDYSRFPKNEDDTFLSCFDSVFVHKKDMVNKAKHLVKVFGLPTDNEAVYDCFLSRWGNYKYEKQFIELKEYLVSVGVNPPKLETNNEEKYKCLGMELAEKIFS